MSSIFLRSKKVGKTRCLTVKCGTIDSAQNSANLCDILKLQIPVVAACNSPIQRGLLHVFHWKIMSELFAAKIVFGDGATLRLSGHVTACGGGTVCRHFTIEVIRDCPKFTVVSAVSKQKEFGPFIFNRHLLVSYT
jgi:hypothetical protein